MDSKLDTAIRYLVSNFMDQNEDALCIDITLPNGKLINIHICYVKESK